MFSDDMTLLQYFFSLFCKININTHRDVLLVVDWLTNVHISKYRITATALYKLLI